MVINLLLQGITIEITCDNLIFFIMINICTCIEFVKQQKTNSLCLRGSEKASAYLLPKMWLNIRIFGGERISWSSQELFRSPFRYISQICPYTSLKETVAIMYISIFFYLFYVSEIKENWDLLAYSKIFISLLAFELFHLNIKLNYTHILKWNQILGFNLLTNCSFYFLPKYVIETVRKWEFIFYFWMNVYISYILPKCLITVHQNMRNCPPIKFTDILTKFIYSQSILCRWLQNILIKI